MLTHILNDLRSWNDRWRFYIL